MSFLIPELQKNIDIQYTVGVATGVPVVFISVGETNNDGNLFGFLDIVNFLLGESSRPQVMTTSYGENEADLSVSDSVYVSYRFRDFDTYQLCLVNCATLTCNSELSVLLFSLPPATVVSRVDSPRAAAPSSLLSPQVALSRCLANKIKY
jgi:hypothetical protein